MKCEQVQILLVSYLNRETTLSERALIQAHLSGCSACREEMSLLSVTQGQISVALQRRAGQAVPAEGAWECLQARLTEDAQPSSSNLGAWFSRLAPDAKQLIQSFFGGVTMYKKWTLFSALAAIAAMTAAVVFSAGMTTNVSAREILDRASAAQSVTAVSNGIQHIKIESYFLKDLADSAGVKTILDSYGDLQNGNYWNVTFDANGAVLDVSAYDGTYTYSQDYNVERGNGEPLTIYRTPQNVADLKPAGSGGVVNDKAMFEQMRSDPNVQLVGKETWDDGREAYVLQSQQLVKAMANGLVEHPEGLTTIYFDASTYKQIGYRMTMPKDGGELLLMSQKILVDEILPTGTNVPLNLDSLLGVVIVDDPNREHGDLLPEVITPEELAAKTTSGYLLKTTPDGFTLELTAPPKQPEGDPYIYIASYRNEANDYFVIQSGVGLPSEPSNGSCSVVSGVKTCSTEQVSGNTDETYTTTSGLVMHFMNMQIPEHPADSTMIEAVAEAADGMTFMVTSTLPIETIKAWAEDLAPVQQ